MLCRILDLIIQPLLCMDKTFTFLKPINIIPPNPTLHIECECVSLSKPSIKHFQKFIFGTEVLMCPKNARVVGRGLGWPRWDPSHSNLTPIPPGPVVQNCPSKLYNLKLSFWWAQQPSCGLVVN